MGLKQLDNGYDKISLIKIVGHLNSKQKQILSAYTAHWLTTESPLSDSDFTSFKSQQKIFITQTYMCTKVLEKLLSIGQKSKFIELLKLYLTTDSGFNLDFEKWFDLAESTGD